MLPSTDYFLFREGCGSEERKQRLYDLRIVQSFRKCLVLLIGYLHMIQFRCIFFNKKNNLLL